MKKAIAFMGIGAGLMYLFDPTHGEERRGQLKEKFAGMMPQTKDALSAKTEAVAAKVDELTSQVDTVAAQKVESPAGFNPFLSAPNQDLSFVLASAFTHSRRLLL